MACRSTIQLKNIEEEIPVAGGRCVRIDTISRYTPGSAVLHSIA